MGSSAVVIGFLVVCYPLIMVLAENSSEIKIAEPVNGERFHEQLAEDSLSRLILRKNVPLPNAHTNTPNHTLIKNDVYGTIVLRKNVTPRLSECNRYCIERRQETQDFPRRVNLIWSFANDKTEMKNYHSSAPTQNLTENNSLEKNCQVYLDVGCEIIKIKNIGGSIRHVDDFSKELLFDENDFSGFTRKCFNVDDSMSGIDISLLGNLSYAILEITLKNESLEDAHLAISGGLSENVDGTRIVALKAPPGEWCLKLVGVENLKYRFTIATLAAQPNDFLSESNNFDYSETYTSREMMEQSLEDVDYIPTASDLDEFSILPEDPSITVVSVHKRTVDKESIVQTKLPEETHTSNEKEVGDQAQEIRSKLAQTLSREHNESFVSFPGNLSSRVINTDAKLSELEDFSRNAVDQFDYSIEKRKIFIDLDPSNSLIASSASIHRLMFLVKNNFPQPVRFSFRVTSEPLKIVDVQPLYSFVESHRVQPVFVDIDVPPMTTTDDVNTVRLIVECNLERAEKSTYLYIRNQATTMADSVNPTIRYWFNNNCAGRLSFDRCDKTRWSVDITVQDTDSGLKSVVSNPNNLYPVDNFISGTKSPVRFYYSATCCSTSVEVTAVDVLNNKFGRVIDVTAWDNLMEGEIAAVVVGALLILLLIILIVLIILYCVRTNKSHDLPYTQRYGSRPPASRTEGTNF
ncbi:uncharacterized protein [Prorops nasuta]|uniref:uncharacterized protein isoform X2 n=1 Tax=Prorops nasuta TaxID=863751 RepID=UPI0034CD0DAD